MLHNSRTKRHMQVLAYLILEMFSVVTMAILILVILIASKPHTLIDSDPEAPCDSGIAVLPLIYLAVIGKTFPKWHSTKLER